MRKLFGLSFVFAALIMLSACQEESAVSTAPADETKTASTVWPPVSDEAVTLADDYFYNNIVLVLDMSGSMEEQTCEQADVSKDAASKVAIREFLADVPADTNLGFVVFEGGTNRVMAPLARNNEAVILDALNRVHPNGGTPLGVSVKVAYDMLLEQGRAQQGYGTYRMLIVTDGAASDETLLDKNVGVVAKHTPVEIFTAGFCIDKGHTLYQPGLTEFRTAGNIAQLKDSMKAVLAESNSFDDTVLTFGN